MSVPALRIQAVSDRRRRPEGDFVLYWMIACRRLDWSFALERAVEHARELERPLVILEALRVGYPWASDRLHRFVLDGMADHARRLAGSNVLYYPYVEPADGAGKGLLAALAERAAVVVTDDFPCFFLPRMVAAAGRELPVRLEKVDSNGLLPLRAADKVFARAYDFRRFLQRELPAHLGDVPKEHPLVGAPLPPLEELPGEITRRWPRASPELLAGGGNALADLPIDHRVGPAGRRGGAQEASALLRRFLEERLDRYDEERNQPDREVTSGLSPYLHFGHLSPHQIFTELARREGWTPERLSHDASGQRRGWWGMSAPAEAFLDQLVTWRELGYNLTWQTEDYDRYESLPGWARETLTRHQGDERPHLYDLATFERAATHSELWNAAQRQLVAEGTIHNYLRMVWGKKILEWSPTPQAALEVMIELNDKYALDGRNPNSYSGIFWCLGRYDRPWGPERPIFGTVRFMSLASTRRKLRLEGYLRRHGAQGSLELA